MRQYLLLASILVIGVTGCRNKTCGPVHHVNINVWENGTGYTLVKYDSCNNVLNEYRQSGPLDTAVLIDIMKDVPKDEPIKLQQ